ncbi:hypothetical protein HY971_04140, partial [Candidatus Kaiserbacteria bacterium]|nr:hypothetical protein [Candidatus Kaiserbacteria bacterium]
MNCAGKIIVEFFSTEISAIVWSVRNCKAMEEKMRAEIESQMRSGNFDMSKLPPDFRPEGAFLPPEAYSRPPD